MRFVHVADVHLDTSFAGRSEAVRRRLREGSREAFRSAVDLAIREDAHAFLIAGDLFDSERLSFQTERFLLAEARRLADHGITVVYATGNHDPGSPEAGPRPLRWPTHVHVATDATPLQVTVHDREGTPVGMVTTVGHETSRVRDDLSRRLPPPEGDLPHVALLHTQVHTSSGSEAHHPYAPSDLGYLSRAGYDYWALGHVHVHQRLSEDPPIVYAGCLQGRTHTDTGPRGAVLVDLTHRAAPAISFRPLASVRWETLRVGELHAADSLDRLERRIQAAWREAREDDPEGTSPVWMIRVILEGPSPLWKELRSEEDLALLAKELRELLGALDVLVLADRIHPVVAVEEYAKRTDALGEALRLLHGIVRGEEELDGLDAADLAGLEPEDLEGVDAYARRLLDGAEGELVARFLGDEEAR